MRQFITFLLFVLSTPSFACLCWNDSFPLTYLNQNDTLPTNQHHFIIKGVVIDNQIGTNVFNRWGHGNLVNIKVLEYWPKDAVMNDTITIMNDENDCASGFLKDSTYLIGTWNSNRYLGTDQCEGTGLFSEYAHLIEQLGEPGIPRTDQHYIPEAEQPSERTWNINAVLIAALGCSLLLNIVLIARRRKDVHNNR
ncbi:MAG: hypothetical protein R8G66_21705 [Cytophagales bacterium]|nr:hypothetical protein [Cytophagales bacterium]